MPVHPSAPVLANPGCPATATTIAATLGDSVQAGPQSWMMGYKGLQWSDVFLMELALVWLVAQSISPTRSVENDDFVAGSAMATTPGNWGWYKFQVTDNPSL